MSRTFWYHPKTGTLVLDMHNIIQGAYATHMFSCYPRSHGGNVCGGMGPRFKQNSPRNEYSACLMNTRYQLILMTEKEQTKVSNHFSLTNRPGNMTASTVQLRKLVIKSFLLFQCSFELSELLRHT